MIRSLVNERGRTAGRAESDIMEAWGKELIEAGPIITIPGVKTEEIITRSEKEGEKVEIVKTPFTLGNKPQALEHRRGFQNRAAPPGYFFSTPLFRAGEAVLPGQGS